MYLSSILPQLNKPNPEWWARLTDIIMPTFIIGGRFSHILQNKLQEDAELIPNCEFVTIEDAGHFVHDTNFIGLLSCLKKFS